MYLIDTDPARENDISDSPVMKDVNVTDVQPITEEYDLLTVKQQFASWILSNPELQLLHVTQGVNLPTERYRLLALVLKGLRRLQMTCPQMVLGIDMYAM